MIATTSGGKRISLDYRETAPAKAFANMYLDKKGNALPELSQNGHLAVGIPGAVAGMFAMHKYAKLPMARLIQPAIDLAEQGFAITPDEAKLLNEHKADFIKYSSGPSAFVKNTDWKTGDILRQSELAETLRRIQQSGEKGFYEGKTAELIVAEMKKGKGIITAADLKNYKVQERTPLSFPYKGHQIVTMPLPSSGGILLAQMFGMTSLVGLDGKEVNSPEAVQLMVEAERRAYADRAEYLGDPSFVADKTEMLTNADYIRRRFADYNPKAATPSSAVGKIIPAKESEQTTHISVLDKEGNAVSATTTLNGLYGSRTVVAGAGFLLNNEMDDFSIKPGVPNMYGAVGNEANAIQPGKRMLSSMSPTVVLKNNKPAIVVGTPGGTTIPTSVFQSIVNVLDFKKNANEAVNLPKFHHQWLPEVVSVEEGFPQHTIRELEKMNYKIQKREKIGRVEMIVVEDSGFIHAVGDGRGDDSVAWEK